MIWDQPGEPYPRISDYAQAHRGLTDLKYNLEPDHGYEGPDLSDVPHLEKT